MTGFYKNSEHFLELALILSLNIVNAAMSSGEL